VEVKEKEEGSVMVDEKNSKEAKRMKKKQRKMEYLKKFIKGKYLHRSIKFP
jgi:hypothetical protein